MDHNHDSSMFSVGTAASSVDGLPPIDRKMRGWHLSDDPDWADSRNEAMRKTTIKKSRFETVHNKTTPSSSTRGSPRSGSMVPTAPPNDSKEERISYDILVAERLVENPNELRRYQLIPAPTRKRRFDRRSPCDATPVDFLNFKRFQDSIRKKERNRDIFADPEFITSMEESADVFATSPGPMVQNRSYSLDAADTYPRELLVGGRKAKKKRGAKAQTQQNMPPTGQNWVSPQLKDPRRMLHPRKYERDLLHAKEQNYVARAAASANLKAGFDATSSRSPKPSPVASGNIDYTDILDSPEAKHKREMYANYLLEQELRKQREAEEQRKLEELRLAEEEERKRRKKIAEGKGFAGKKKSAGAMSRKILQMQFQVLGSDEGAGAKKVNKSAIDDEVARKKEAEKERKRKLLDSPEEKARVKEEAEKAAAREEERARRAREKEARAEARLAHEAAEAERRKRLEAGNFSAGVIPSAPEVVAASSSSKKKATAGSKDKEEAVGKPAKVRSRTGSKEDTRKASQHRSSSKEHASLTSKEKRAVENEELELISNDLVLDLFAGATAVEAETVLLDGGMEGGLESLNALLPAAERFSVAPGPSPDDAGLQYTPEGSPVQALGSKTATSGVAVGAKKSTFNKHQEANVEPVRATENKSKSSSKTHDFKNQVAPSTSSTAALVQAPLVVPATETDSQTQNLAPPTGTTFVDPRRMLDRVEPHAPSDTPPVAVPRVSPPSTASSVRRTLQKAHTVEGAIAAAASQEGRDIYFSDEEKRTLSDVSEGSGDDLDAEALLAERERQRAEEEKRRNRNNNIDPGPGHYNQKPMWCEGGARWSMGDCPPRNLLRQGTNWLLKPSFELANPGPGHYGDVGGRTLPSQASFYMGVKPPMWKPELNDPQIPTATHLFKPGPPYFSIKGKLPAQKSAVTFSFEYRPGKEFYEGSRVALSSDREFFDEFGSMYSLDGQSTREAERFMSPEKRRQLSKAELDHVKKMEKRAAGREQSETRAPSSLTDHGASKGELLGGEDNSSNFHSTLGVGGGHQHSMSTLGPGEDTSMNFRSIQSETSLMYPPTSHVEELRKRHNMRTRYKPSSYTQIGPDARNFDRFTIAANDRRTTQFTSRPTNTRYDPHEKNWYSQNPELLVSAGLKYANAPSWTADPTKGFSLIGKDIKPMALETAGRDAPVRDVSRYESRTVRTKASGFSWGASSRFGGLYC
ncbi:unnamed protein product [Amoebophrya sp. A25]|nr:unnamed protein product [Amoebophrya sp. A25]|eukprot:GSA25T00020508001.1